MNLLRAIRRQRLVNRAYANGYDQGRFDEHMDILLGRVSCPCCRTTHASVGDGRAEEAS